MASSFMKKFAIENNLTIDYGYTYGKYRDLYFSIKEGVSYRILQVITNIGNDKEKLKNILKVFDSDLEKFCVTDFKFEKNYIEFNFNLSGDKSDLVIEFLNRFIDSYLQEYKQINTYCPICENLIKSNDEISMINYRGIITPVHNDCFEKGKEKIKKKVAVENEKNNQGKSYKKGIVGALVFSIIYILILIGSYCLVVKGIEALSSTETNAEGISQNAFQYLPLLLTLASVPLICYGYEVFGGKIGTHKYLIVLLFSFISSLIGVVFGVFLSFIMVIDTSGWEFWELFKAVFETLYIYKSTQLMLFLSIGISLLLTAISIAFKFGSYKEIKESEKETIEKL